ncbi:HSA protein (macronuclear) [Tetrahymena thermophila SB210]|uniref:HSA protein n=1 Tax=Tetrahymena thermophila (strain SB210) TaxID=312017 RepID=Q23T82_TETTS|nr:HSA protein [Tetrahymena thermophila SB210]EAR99824.2 HSA protein [Tetrahymena thermophila SB210]|eukprot:XP_001020069.2 HSA protein [Tetrahymena thermophila SB210]
MSQNRIQHPHNIQDRNMMVGQPYPVPRNKEMNSTIEKLEDDCGRLPDLYFRKFRLIEKLYMERPQYPFATNVRLSTNKPVFIQHVLWDKVLKEVYWRATDFKEEKKAKIALAFHLSKKMKKHMSKKFLVRDELHFYHKLLCIQLSKDLDDTFSQIRNLKDDSQISHKYIPPHELQEIRKREKEERERKEQEEAERRRQIELQKEEDKFVDMFFQDDEEVPEPQQETIKSPSRQVNQNGQINNENGLNDQDKLQQEQPDGKKFKPIARYIQKMMELNPDSFETPEIKAYQEYRDFERKKDILDKLKDTIIKYGGKRKERPSIDNIFNTIYPQQQLPPQNQQQQDQANIQDKQIKNEFQLSSAQEEPQNQEIKEEESQQQQPQQQQKQFVKPQYEEEEIKLDPIQKNNSNESNQFKAYPQEEQMKEEIDYLASSDQKLNDDHNQFNFGEKKEESMIDNNQNEPNFLNDFSQGHSHNQEQGQADDYFNIQDSFEQSNKKSDESAKVSQEAKLEDFVKEGQDPLQEVEKNGVQNAGDVVILEDKNNNQAQNNEQEKSNDQQKSNDQVLDQASGENKADNLNNEADQNAKDLNQVKEEFQDQIDVQNNQETQKVVQIDVEAIENAKNASEENKQDDSKKEEDVQEIKMEVENIEISEQQIKSEHDEQGGAQNAEQESENQLSEVDKIKQQIKNTLHNQIQAYDQSVCSIMQVEVSKKRKKKDDNQKDTLNEEFLNHIKNLNPQIDPKKMKYENLNELLTFNYNKNQLQQEYEKIFEKTINNYSDFPSNFSQIPRVQEVDEDEIEMKGQDLYDLPYETFCFTHGIEMDKFLKKCHQYLSLMVNQDKLTKIGNPTKELLNMDELFKTFPIARKDNNLFAIYTQVDPKQQTMARVFNDSFINSNEKYKVISLISKQPIFFFFFEYYQGIWGNKHHLIANSLNSNPITKHYQFNNKIVEKLDWTLRIKKKEKFAYLSENILPTMYMFKGDNVKVNEQLQHFIEEKKKKEDEEYNSMSNLINEEIDFEEAVNKREKSGAVSILKPQQQIFKNMNKSFANYFSQNKLYDVSNKLEYRKSIIEYARQVKNNTNKYIFDNKEEDKGKTIDYSSFTKMIKVEEVKSQLKMASLNQNNPSYRLISRKKVIIDQNNELYLILNNLKSQIPNNMSGPQPTPHGNMPPEMMPNQGGPYRGPHPSQHMRPGMPMMSRQNSNMAHAPYPNYPPNGMPPNPQQHMNPSRTHHGQYDPANGPQSSQVPPGPGNPPIPPQGHHSQSIQQVPPSSAMMHHRQPPPHGMNPNSQGPERGQSGVPPGNPPPVHMHPGQGPPPYNGQPAGGPMNQHHHHHSMQGHQPNSNSQQNTPGGHPPMHNQPPHGQMGPGGMHHPPGGSIEKNMGPPHHNGGMPNHPQPPPYHSGPPPHGHGYQQGNMPPHSSQMPPQGPHQGGNMGHPPMKQMHGQHQNYPPNHQMNAHNQNMPPHPQGQPMPPNHPGPGNPQGPPMPPMQQQSSHDPIPINKKIKKSTDNTSPKKPAAKKSIQGTASAAPSQASDNTSEKGTPKKKKQTKKKKNQDDPSQVSQSQLSMPNQ